MYLYIYKHTNDILMMSPGSASFHLHTCTHIYKHTYTPIYTYLSLLQAYATFTRDTHTCKHMLTYTNMMACTQYRDRMVSVMIRATPDATKMYQHSHMIHM